MKLFIYTTLAIMALAPLAGCSTTGGARAAKPANCCCSDNGCKHDGNCNCPSHEKCPSCKSGCDCGEQKGCCGNGGQHCGK